MKIAIDWAFWVGKTTLVDKVGKSICLKRIANTEREIASKTNFNFNTCTDSELKEFQELLRLRQERYEQECWDFITDCSCVIQDAYWDTWVTDTYDYHFYVPIEFDIENDWVRHIDKEFQELISKKILAIYEKNNIKYITVTWTIQERVDLILTTILW
jgi:hypothetical protein